MAEDEVTYDEDEAYLAVTMTISLATKPSTAAGPGPATGLPPIRAAVNLADRLARQAPRPFGEKILICRTGMVVRPAPAACDRDLGRFPCAYLT